MKRHALFVGVEQYADGHIPNLSCAVSDATDLHGFFKYGAGYDQVLLLPNPSSKKEVLGAVRSLTAGLGPDDFFLFFFAGHGFRVGENHVLVCSNDLYDDVKYEDDGLPLGQLKRRLSGPFDSALLLDACQSDILATRGGEGIAERDIKLIHDASTERPGCGALTIVTSCDAGQTAAELSERRHGLFTVAMLDLLREAQRTHARLDLSDAFRLSLGQRMGEIAARFGLPTEQRPRFSCTGNSCFILLDGIAAAPAAQSIMPRSSLSSVSSAMTPVVCPECGRYNVITDTFKCKICGRDHLCKEHYSKDERCCADCALRSRTTVTGVSVGTAAEEEARRIRENVENWYSKGDDFLFELNGCRKDYVEAVKWYRKAAEQGHAEAQHKLGWMYDKGWGVEQNDTEAARWYRKAADQGNAEAQFRFGWFCYYGRGVPQDYDEAVKWYRKSAEQGYAFSQYLLGGVYADGEVVKQDYAEAAKWYRKAAEQGNEDAKKALERLR